MTASLPHQATGRNGVAVAWGTPPQLDYARVRAYWKRAQPSAAMTKGRAVTPCGQAPKHHTVCALP